MAVVSGLSRYVCDRCSDNEIVEGSGEPVGEWSRFERFDAFGKRTGYLLCGPCKASLDAYKAGDDARFAQWMASWEAEREPAPDGGGA